RMYEAAKAFIAYSPLLLIACSSTGIQTPEANTDRSQHAPRPFSAEQISRAWRLHSVRTYRTVQKGKPAVISKTQVVEHNAKGVTMLNASYDESGKPLEAPKPSTATWTQLMEHATFPSNRTTIEDATVDIAAGRFVVWKYTVRPSGQQGSGQQGAVRRFYFAKDQPGAPVLFEQFIDDERTFRSELIEVSIDAPLDSKGFDSSAFDLAIYAERLSVILERAEAAFSDNPVSDDNDDVLRIKAALLDGLQRMYRLRANVCRNPTTSHAPCGPMEAPAWLGELPGQNLSLRALHQRVMWLQETAGPFIDAGCQRAKIRSGNPMACSVE
ncbi:MAG: hypothetical protein AAFV29_25815, partial [Myxococcota bacterium]